MAASRRLNKELSDIHHKLEHRELHVDFDCIGSVNVNDSNILSWECTIYPKEAPYDKAGFKIKLEFPAEYPFKPPKLTFATKIYHPNIDEKGQVCLPIISPDNWKPATKTDQVLVSLVKLIHEPELEHPLRGDLAEEYSRNFKKFAKSAEEWAKKYGLERK